jgi:heme-degrading monooxygenase HmoA
LFVHETQEEAMPAHVWQLHVRPGKLQDFRDILSSLVELAREQGGYRGIVALASGKSESPDVTLVALWDSLEAIRASENSLFLTQAISRFLVCCEGLPHIMEQDLLTSDFIATSARAKA